jgi:ring-1,2-phenylacetyl-CoA epoxidase subunit PaaD
MSSASLTPAQIWQALDEVADPEIPVVSLVEMGIVRDVAVSASGAVTVQMTPTFAGCPALHVMREDIAAKLEELGATAVTVETILSPPGAATGLSPKPAPS